MSNMSVIKAGHAYAIRIVGFGDPTASTATDKRFWLGTRRLTTDPDNLVITSLGSYPKSIRSEVSIVDRRLEGDSKTFRLWGDEAEMAALVAELGKVHPRPVARLTLDAAPSDTVIALNRSGLAGSSIHIGLEVILLGTETSTGVYESCIRAQLGTQARRHLALRDPLVYLGQSVWEGRAVELISYDPGGSYDDHAVMWTGLLIDREGSPQEFVIKAESALGFVNQVNLVKDTWKGVVSTTAIDDTLVKSGASTRPFAGSDDDPLFLMAVGGTAGMVAKYDSVGDGTYSAYYEVLQEDHKRLDTNPISFPDYVNQEVLFEFFSTLDEAPPIRAEFSGDLQKLSSNPIRFMQQILTTTESGTNGDWDLGQKQLGVGLGTEALDHDSWDRFASRFDGSQFKLRLIFGEDGQAVAFKDLQDRVFAPLHVALAPRAGGLGIVGWRDTIPYEGGDHVAGPVNHYGDPSSSQYTGAAAIDQVEVRWGQQFGLSGMQLNLSNGTRQERYPHTPAGDLTIDATAYDRSYAQTAGIRIEEAYREPSPILTFRASRDEIDAWPGEIIDYTHPHALGDGTIGVTGVAAVVLGRQLNLGSHGSHETVDYTIQLTGLGLDRSHAIANSAKVFAFTPSPGSGTPHEIIIERDHFKDSGSLPLSPDSAPWSAGDLIMVRDETLAIKPSPLESLTVKDVLVDTPSGYDTIQIKSTITVSGVVAGDIIRHAHEGDARATQRAAFAWAAPGGDDPSDPLTTQFTSGREGNVYGLSLTAREGSASNVFGWNPLDDEAADDDGVVDEALLEKLASSVNSLARGCLASTSVSMDGAVNPLKLHGYPTTMCVPLVWPKERTVRELTLVMLCESFTADVTVAAALVYANGVSSERFSEQVISAGFSGRVEFVIPLPRSEGIFYPVLLAESDLDTDGRVTIASERVTVIESNYGRYIGTENSLAGSGGSPTLDASKVYAIGQTNASSSTTKLMADRLYLRTSAVLSSPANFQHWVWPTYTEQEFEGVFDSYSGLGTQPATDLSWTPIGHLHVWDIMLKESDSDAGVPELKVYRAGMETASRTIRDLGAALGWIYRRRTSVLHAGGSLENEPRLFKTPNSDIRLPTGTMAWTASTSAGLPFDWHQCLWSCWGGLYNSKQTRAGDTSHQRTIIIEGALAVWSRFDDLESIDIVLRAAVESPANGGSRAVGEAVAMTVPVGLMSWTKDPFSNLGWLRLAACVSRLSAGANQFVEFSDHPARSLYPFNASASLSRWGLLPFRVEVEDTFGDNASTQRRVKLEQVAPQRRGDPNLLRAPHIFVPFATAYIQRGIEA